MGGASMDGKLLKEAAEAHHKAIGSVDAKLVTSAADFQAVNAALGKVIASVPTSQVMDVYNAFGKIVSPVIPNFLYSSVNPADAQAAYTALLGFKDVVKAAQRLVGYSWTEASGRCRRLNMDGQSRFDETCTGA